MKKVFFVLAGLFTIIALILAFENMMVTFAGLIFFTSANTSAFYPMILMFFLGIIAGFFLALGFKSQGGSSGGDDF